MATFGILECAYLDPKNQPTETNVTCDSTSTRFCYKFVTIDLQKVYKGCANEATTAPDSPFTGRGKDPNFTPCKHDGHEEREYMLTGAGGGEIGVADLYCCSTDVCNAADRIALNCLLDAVRHKPVSFLIVEYLKPGSNKYD
ncbi:hypothetical protein AAVH_10339 [Aphelenchoides avenae]|nr:hypothetical protein AAVH_10339 [Aphelenchus avenae]